MRTLSVEEAAKVVLDEGWGEMIEPASSVETLGVEEAARVVVVFNESLELRLEWCFNLDSPPRFWSA